MCTVTAWPGHNQTKIYFNRDEMKTRPRAKPLSAHTTGGTSWLGCIDPVGGGTWLGVNAYGVAVGLLNYYHAGNVKEAIAGGSTSRGQLVVHLLGQGRAQKMETVMDSCSVHAYQPFHCFVIQREGGGHIWTWNGQQLIKDRIEDAPWFYSSSSYKTHDVIAFRKARFSKLQTAFESSFSRETPDIHAYHFRLHPEHPMESPLMLREQTKTRSISLVTLSPEMARYDFWAVDPHGKPESQAQSQTLDIVT